MVTRVTNQAQQNTALRNIFRITNDLFQANERIASGKRINSLSDDPSGIRDAITIKSSISQISQFRRNIDNNTVFAESADSALGSVDLGLIRARELGLQSLSGTDTAETRLFAATEIDNIIEQALQSANTQVKNHFLFSGSRVRTEPYVRSTAGILYRGDSNSFDIQIARNQNIPLSIPGSDVFGADLNPAINTTTNISSLNFGAGVPAGSFNITDRSGTTGTVNITAGSTIAAVIAAINGAGTNVTASLNSAQTGLVLNDSSTVITQSLTVADTAGGSTAAALGIQGQSDGSINGQDLDPLVTTSTLVSDLNGGQGLNLGSVNIVNGAASGAVSLSTATTVGDVLTTINGAGLNVTAAINSQGNALSVTSNSTSTTAVVSEVGNGTTAEALGIGGAGNVFVNLLKLQDALQKDDNFGIIASLDQLEASLNKVNNARASLGAITRRLQTTTTVHEQDEVDQTTQLAEIEDSDIIQEASNVAQLEFALEATLNTSARILQPSLLDFIR